MRRVIIVMDELGVSAGEAHGERVLGTDACDALGAWVYANRERLGLEICVATPRAFHVAPAQSVDAGVLYAVAI